jgi:hypothetical protein
MNLCTIILRVYEITEALREKKILRNPCRSINVGRLGKVFSLVPFPLAPELGKDWMDFVSFKRRPELPSRFTGLWSWHIGGSERL